jgi:FkbH-like protein
VSVALADRVLVKSGFVEQVTLDTGAVLCVHALTQARIVLKSDMVAVLDAFEQPRRVGEWADECQASRGVPRETALHAVSSLLEQRLLYAGTREEERARFAALLSQWYGRDPEDARRADHRWRLHRLPRFAAPAARDLASFAPLARRLDVVLIGLCETQIGLDVVRDEGRALGLELNLVPTFESTLEVLTETRHDAIVVGPLAERHGHWHAGDGGGDLWPPRYDRAVRDLLLRIRAASPAPVLLHNLPVPTCSAAGLTDRGPDSPVERCRAINRALTEVASEMPDVYVVDVDAALSFAGKRRLLDDRVMTGTHLGGLGWWTLLPDVELRTVHGIRPPIDRLADLGVDDPFEFDRVVAGAQLSLLCAIFGHGRRDVVVVSPDGLLWPGHLADTRIPFPLDVDYGQWSFHGFYIGVQDALKGLLARGVRLALVTRAAEADARAWWRYPGKAPLDRLVLPSDFTSARFGVDDVASALQSIADEVEVSPAEMVFVSADDAQRAGAAAACPALLVLGENLFEVRGTLLTHPSLQSVRVPQEGVEHPAMMVALARREQARKAAGDDVSFAQSLGIRCTIRRGLVAADADRVCELVASTRQFTTTGRVFRREELVAMASDPARGLYTLRVEDRFADYGLVGVAVVVGDTIELFLLSCRVVALGVQAVFLRHILRDIAREHPVVRGRQLRLERNAAARGLFKDHGFTESAPGLWEITREDAERLPPLPGHLASAVEEGA